MKYAKLLQKAINSPANLRFGDLVTLARAAGFKLERITGSHHIFAHPRVFEQLNLQNVGSVLRLCHEVRTLPERQRKGETLSGKAVP